jgi:hypothetical protein
MSSAYGRRGLCVIIFPCFCYFSPVIVEDNSVRTQHSPNETKKENYKTSIFEQADLVVFVTQPKMGQNKKASKILRGFFLIP